MTNYPPHATERAADKLIDQANSRTARLSDAVAMLAQTISRQNEKLFEIFNFAKEDHKQHIAELQGQYYKEVEENDELKEQIKELEERIQELEEKLASRASKKAKPKAES